MCESCCTCSELQHQWLFTSSIRQKLHCSSKQITFHENIFRKDRERACHVIITFFWKLDVALCSCNEHKFFEYSNSSRKSDPLVNSYSFQTTQSESNTLRNDREEAFLMIIATDSSLKINISLINKLSIFSGDSG